MDKEKQKTAEMNELNRLIGRGVKFHVRRKIRVRRPGLLGWIRKREIKEEDLEFTIQEPTLAVLDRISAEGVLMEIDENVVTTSDGFSEAKKFTKEHSIRMARVVALAVLGEDYTIQVQRGSGVKYIEDTKRLAELTSLFAHTIKPSQLVNLCVTINTMANLGDFTNCMRLMSANRTTIPDRIQK